MRALPKHHGREHAVTTVCALGWAGGIERDSCGHSGSSPPLAAMLLLAACALAAWCLRRAQRRGCCRAGLWFQFMEPTEAEAAELSTFDLVSTFSRLPEPPLAERMGSHILRALWPRGLLAPPRRRQHSGERLPHLLSQLLIDGNRPTTAQRSKEGLVDLACRAMCGVRERSADERKPAVEENEQRA